MVNRWNRGGWEGVRVTILLLVVSAFTGALVGAKTVNVRDCGAKGDGKTDDTAALKKAIQAASEPDGGDLFLPAGYYMVSETLTLEKITGLTLRGEGTVSIHWPFKKFQRAPTATCLIWDGEPGEVMLKSLGCSGLAIRDLVLDGRDRRKDRPEKKARVLFLSVSEPNAVDAHHRFHNVCFLDAETGIQMGDKDRGEGSSDMRFESVVFNSLDTAFWTRHPESVNHSFQDILILNCSRGLYFERGGNVSVNGLQASVCDRLICIDGGGRANGAFRFDDVRLETLLGGKERRDQLLSCHPSEGPVVVRFATFNDIQWAWFDNKSEMRHRPLCDIGPGSLVTFENAIINGPLAEMMGLDERPSFLTVRDSYFSYVAPDQAIAANAFGYFRVLDSLFYNRLFADVMKWPDREPKQLPPQRQIKRPF